MRYLLIDKITALDPPDTARGIKCVSLAEAVYADHFVRSPTMPGALVIESLAQLAGALIETSERERGNDRRLALLAMVDKARFRRAARPGDRLLLTVTTAVHTDDGWRVRGTANVADELIAEAQLGFVLIDDNPRELIEERQRMVELWLHGTAYR